MKTRHFILFLLLAGCASNRVPTPISQLLSPNSELLSMDSRAQPELVLPPRDSITALTPTVDMAWDSSGDGMVYQVYYGRVAHNYETVVACGTNCTATVGGLDLSDTYYFSVTCTDTNGIESDLSPQLACNAIQTFKLHFELSGQLQSSTNLADWSDVLGAAPGKDWRVAMRTAVGKQFFRVSKATN